MSPHRLYSLKNTINTHSYLSLRFAERSSLAIPSQECCPVSLTGHFIILITVSLFSFMAFTAISTYYMRFLVEVTREDNFKKSTHTITVLKKQHYPILSAFYPKSHFSNFTYFFISPCIFLNNMTKLRFHNLRILDIRMENNFFSTYAHSFIVLFLTLPSVTSTELSHHLAQFCHVVIFKEHLTSKN